MVILIFFALLCFIIPAVIWGIFILAFRLRSSEAIGTIVDYHTSDGEYGQLSAPIVEFQLPDGGKITFTEKIHSNETILDIVSGLFRKFALKQDVNKVKVLYDPNDPQKARVNTFGNLYFMPFILSLIGLCMILYAVPVTREFFTPVLNFLERLADIL
jgi:hypothetical protein